MKNPSCNYAYDQVMLRRSNHGNRHVSQHVQNTELGAQGASE
jgi:hypothetical protein